MKKPRKGITKKFQIPFMIQINLNRFDPKLSRISGGEIGKIKEELGLFERMLRINL